MPRVNLRIERRGLLLLVASASLLAGGLLRVDGTMASLGAAGALLAGIGALAARANLQQLQIERSGPRTANAGQMIRLQLRLIHARRGLDSFQVDAAATAAGGGEAKTHAPWIAASTSIHAELRMAAGSRGDHPMADLRLESSFPLGLFQANTHSPCSERMLVFPKPLVPIELLDRGAWNTEHPRSSMAAGDAHGEPRGLRPHRAGDPARSICWPATLRSQARGGGLLVRELDPPGFQPSEVVVLFHSFGSQRALIRPDRFERALSLAWGALRHFHDLRVPVRLRADFDAWQARSATTRRQLAACGELLTRARRCQSTEVHELQTLLSSLDQSIGLLVISDMPPSSWKNALPHRGPRVWVDVTRYEPRSTSSRHRHHA